MMDELQAIDGIFKQGFGIIGKIPMRDKRLSPEAKAIYAYICSFAGAGGTAFPSVALICDELGMSDGRFYRHKKQLEELGYIECSQQRQGNRLTKNIYKIVGFPRSQSPRFEGTQNERTQNVDTQNEGTNNNSSTNNNSNNNSIKKTPPTPSKGKSGYSEEFEIFWKAYPNKKAKGNAYKAWEKARKAKTLPELEKLLTALEAQKRGADWQKEGGRFIPHPATWLNASRWEDEVTPQGRNSYAPNENGKSRYIRESEQNFDNLPMTEDGFLDWSKV